MGESLKSIPETSRGTTDVSTKRPQKATGLGGVIVTAGAIIELTSRALLLSRKNTGKPQTRESARQGEHKDKYAGKASGSETTSGGTKEGEVGKLAKEGRNEPHNRGPRRTQQGRG